MNTQTTEKMVVYVIGILTKEVRFVRTPIISNRTILQMFFDIGRCPHCRKHGLVEHEGFCSEEHKETFFSTSKTSYNFQAERAIGYHVMRHEQDECTRTMLQYVREKIWAHATYTEITRDITRIENAVKETLTKNASTQTVLTPQKVATLKDEVAI